MIRSHAHCPGDTAFFVVQYERLTVAIPTSEILRVSYAAVGRNVAGLISGEITAEQFEADDIWFDGFAYTRAPRVVYPFRSARNLERARFELSQLLPRACAYNRRSGGGLPILIRPPFTGRVVLKGKAITRRDATGEVVLFVSLDGYSVPHKLSDGYSERWRERLAFAPFLNDNSVTLPAVEAQGRHPTNADATNFDVRYFGGGISQLQQGQTWTKAWKRWTQIVYPTVNAEDH